MDLLEHLDEQETLTPILREAWDSLGHEDNYVLENSDAMADYVLGHHPGALNSQPAQPERLRIYAKSWFRYAAILILAALTGAYLWLAPFQPKKAISTTAHVQLPESIAPGRDGAILTLSDGSRVMTDSLGNGTINGSKGAEGILTNGVLSYQTLSGGMSETGYNTVSTPRGRKFMLLLSDGTKVWLNAASSIRYPVRFGSSERKVEISGEAYLEVAANAAVPFSIQLIDKTEIQVLGTVINVEAYPNELAGKTTLVSGSIRVSQGSVDRAYSLHPENSVILKPGQQCIMNNAPGNNNNRARVETVDTRPIVAWKNDLFYFDEERLDLIIKKLSRWYDVDIVLEPAQLGDMRFSAVISRTESLSNILKMMEQIEGFGFRHEKNTIYIYKKTGQQ